MRCIVVEDEPGALALMQQHITNCPGLICEGFFENAYVAQKLLDTQSVDLMFLDINLPGMSGVSFLKTLVKPPLVIFTTAYGEYAVEGYELEIVDFLLKPFSFERFCKAVNKAKERLAARMEKVPGVISVKADKCIYRVNPEELFSVEACGDYVTLRFADRKLVVHGTLKSWEERLAGYPFVKVHRTCLVNPVHIDHLEGNLIMIGGVKLPLAESNRQLLLDRMFSGT